MSHTFLSHFQSYFSILASTPLNQITEHTHRGALQDLIRQIAETNDSKDMPSLKQDAKAWGKIAWDTKKALETKTGKKVVSKKNYLINNKKELWRNYMSWIND
jgi:hypothetical protein